MNPYDKNEPLFIKVKQLDSFESSFMESHYELNTSGGKKSVK